MTDPRWRWLHELDARYTAFNSSRTVMDAIDSTLERRDFGPLVAFREPARGKRPTFNRVIGLTDAGLPSLDDALAWLDDPAVEPRVDIDDADDQPEAAARLSDIGFRHAGTLHWLTMTAEQAANRPVASDHTGIAIERLQPRDADRFFDLMQGQDDVIAPDVRAARRPYYCTDTFATFLAVKHDTVMGWATAFLGGDVAWLGNVFVLPDHRKQGAHRALLEARIAHVLGLGLPTLLVDCEPDTTSERNTIRAGFEPMMKQTWWLKRPDAVDNR